jgi:glycerophosphoryl diester phosphodiesterase
MNPSNTLGVEMKKWLVGIHIGCLLVTGAVPALQGADSLIDLRDRNQIEKRRPVLIAHRGGVVGVKSPECSLAAIRLAAEAGYAMVELDVQKSSDEVPIIFHDSTLKEACGVEGSVADYAAVDLVKIHYTSSNQRIVRLDTVLTLCRELHLGVMLDLKAGRDDRPFLRKIDKMIVDHGLANATVSISGTSAAREELRHVMFTPDSDQMAQFRKGEKVDLRGTFWFGLPERLPSADVGRLQKRGALVFPAINTFRYPSDRHLDLAREDIVRLMSAGVDGFQIDSVYSNLLNRK